MIDLFERLRGEDGAWSAFERTELSRLKQAFGAQLYDQTWSEGVTDSGDPWVVAVDHATDEMVLHLARMGEIYAILDRNLEVIARGPILRSVVSESLSHLPVETGARAAALRITPDLPVAMLAAMLVDWLRAMPYGETGQPSDADSAAHRTSDDTLAGIAPGRADTEYGPQKQNGVSSDPDVESLASEDQDTPVTIAEAEAYRPSDLAPTTPQLAFPLAIDAIRLPNVAALPKSAPSEPYVKPVELAFARPAGVDLPTSETEDSTDSAAQPGPTTPSDSAFFDTEGFEFVVTRGQPLVSPTLGDTEPDGPHCPDAPDPTSPEAPPSAEPTPDGDHTGPCDAAGIETGTLLADSFAFVPGVPVTLSDAPDPDAPKSSQSNGTGDPEPSLVEVWLFGPLGPAEQTLSDF